MAKLSVRLEGDEWIVRDARTGKIISREKKPKTRSLQWKKGQANVVTACYELRAQYVNSEEVVAVGVGRKDGNDVLVVHTAGWHGAFSMRNWMGFPVVYWPQGASYSAADAMREMIDLLSFRVAATAR